MSVVPAVIRRAVADNKLFAILLVPAFLLRVDAELGYRWQSWFNDSWDYMDTAITLRLDPTRTSGYALYMWLLKPFHSLALVTISQHVMGLLVAVMIYALARHRFGAPEWLAVVMTLPVLYDGFEIQLEHLILADTLFLFLVMAAVTLLLWWPLRRASALTWLRCAGAGLLVGLSAIVRATGLPLLPVFGLYLLIALGLARVGWRTLLASAAAFAIAGIAPVLGYAGAYDVQHGEFATSESAGVFLYSRVMTFADCSKLSLPVDLLELCTTVPPDKRPIAQAYIWAPASPLNVFPGSKFSPLPNKLAEEFAIKAIEGQPLAYVRTVLDDTWRAFDWPRTAFPNAATYDEYLFGYVSVPVAPGHAVDGYPSSAQAYLDGANPATSVVNPFAGLIRLYQRYIYLPGTVYGLILLAGLFGMALAWRRAGGEALLPWATSLMLIVAPAATAEFDYRYVTTAVPFACLALAMAFGRETAGGRWLARRGLGGSALVTGGATTVPGGTADLAGGLPGGGLGGPGGAAVDAGHDQRDLAADAP